MNISITIYYLSFFRQAGAWGKIPWPGQLARPPPHPTRNFANLKSYLIIFCNLQVYCTDIRKVLVPAFTYFFTLREGIGAKILWPKKFATKLRNHVNKLKVQNVIFIFLKHFPFNRSFEYFYYVLLSIFLQIGWVGGKIPWHGKLAPPSPPAVKTPWPGQLAPDPWKLCKLRSEKLFNHLQLKILMHRHENGSSTCFYLFFSIYGKGLGPTYCGPRSLLPMSENLVNKIQVQNVFFSMFLKQFPI